MKELTSKQLKEITGRNNNAILNAISIMLDYIAKDDLKNGYTELAKKHKEEADRYYDILDSMGYYDDIHTK